MGKGHVGLALADGWKRAGHEVRHGHRDPREPVADAARYGEVLVMAVPYTQVGNVVEEMEGENDGKVIIDVTNVFGPDGRMAVGFTTSGAEELQRMVPTSRVVKALNYVFAQNMSTGSVGGRQLTALVAADDEAAKAVVMDLTKDLGFEPMDAGPLRSARYLEPMGFQLIALAHLANMGTSVGYRLVHL